MGEEGMRWGAGVCARQRAPIAEGANNEIISIFFMQDEKKEKKRKKRLTGTSRTNLSPAFLC
jgi:hypothetical protein